MALLGFDARPNFLMLRGPFTDQGMAHLAELEGLYALNVDSNQLAITGSGWRHWQHCRTSAGWRSMRKTTRCHTSRRCRGSGS